MHGQSNPSPHRGKTMAMMVHQRLAPPPVGGINPSYVPLDAAESGRNQAIASNLRGMLGPWRIIKNRVVLPHDNEKSAPARQLEFDKQRAMPWYSAFMHTATDAQRLNNPAQQSAVSQRQLTVPNTYGQFYAFMHAMSAAFGQLK